MNSMPNSPGCIQPVHVCGCDHCDDRRRQQVREFSLRWFEEATWRLLRRRAQARIDAEQENEPFEPAESGVRPSLMPRRPNTTHRQLRPVALKSVAANDNGQRTHSRETRKNAL